MESPTSRERFSVHPDQPLCANQAVLSTIGPTGAAAILDADRGQFYSLNEVGAQVWDLLRGGTTFGAIVERLYGEYDAAPETIGADVECLLGEFVRTGLVLIDGGDDAEC